MSYDEDEIDECDADEEPSFDDEDEAHDKRGTSECDGLCHPQCVWCLVAHACPDDCAGGECPYETLEREQRQDQR